VLPIVPGYLCFLAGTSLDKIASGEDASKERNVFYFALSFVFGYSHCCIEDLGVLRSLPNIKINLAYMQIPITFVGLASGLSLGYLGYSHCCV
jgi:transketolase C-terminal domain/subunit